MTIVTNVYTTVTNTEDGSKSEVMTQKQISAFASYDEESDLHLLTHNLQILQNGYTYFYIDLPDGYVAKLTVTNGKQNTNVSDNDNYYKEDEVGAYKPVSTIVTQKISILIEIEEGENGVIWGEATSDAYTRLAEFISVTESKN